MLKIINLNVNVSEKNILNNFNLNINFGEVHAIMGRNGIGKSTICKTLMGDSSYSVTSGEIIYNSKDLLSMSPNERATEGIYLVSQNPIEIPGVTNAEMLRSALSSKTGKHVPLFEFNKKLEEVCDILHIPYEFIHRGINESMSGGERKKCEIMHLWMLEPKMILLDELDSGLDIDSLNIVCDALNEYKKNHNCAILIITHHKDLLKKLNADFIHILDGGKIIETGDLSLAEKIENEGFSNIISTNKVSDVSGEE